MAESSQSRNEQADALKIARRVIAAVDKCNEEHPHLADIQTDQEILARALIACAGSESVRTVTYHGSGEDLATDVHALLDPTERRRFMAKWKEREDVTKR